MPPNVDGRKLRKYPFFGITIARKMKQGTKIFGKSANLMVA